MLVSPEASQDNCLTIGLCATPLSGQPKGYRNIDINK